MEELSSDASITVWLPVAATLVAAFMGAAAAFYIECWQRKRETVKRNIAAANLALATLLNIWNILRQYQREIIDPIRDKDGAWPNMNAHKPPAFGLASFEIGELSFLLQSKQANVFQELLLEEHRFKIAMQLI